MEEEMYQFYNDVWVFFVRVGKHFRLERVLESVTSWVVTDSKFDVVVLLEDHYLKFFLVKFTREKPKKKLKKCMA